MERGDYDNECNWELNEDNLEGADNRCTEVKSLNLMNLMRMEIIKKHIMVYDYAAVLMVASEMKESIPEDAYALLRIMDARVKLNQREISRRMSGKTYDIYPIKEGDKQKMFEYMLVLQMKIEKQEYADFVRGITPLVVDLLEHILKNRCKIKLDDCCRRKKNGAREWDFVKLDKKGLKELLDDAYKDRGGFKGGIVYASHIANIIKYKGKDAKLKQNLDDIIHVEENVRNVAAHEIVSVTDEWIRERTKRGNKAGKNAREIFHLLKYLAQEAGINTQKEDWRSYDKINESIAYSLDRWM